MQAQDPLLHTHALLEGRRQHIMPPVQHLPIFIHPYPVQAKALPRQRLFRPQSQQGTRTGVNHDNALALVIHQHGHIQAFQQLALPRLHVLQHLVFFPQLLLRILALPQVIQRRTAHHRATGFIPQQGGADRARKNTAILANHVQFQFRDIALTQKTRKVFIEALLALRRQQTAHIALPDQFFTTVAQPGQFRVINPQEHAFRRQGVIAHRGVLIQILTFGQCFFQCPGGQPLLRHVIDGQQHPHHRVAGGRMLHIGIETHDKKTVLAILECIVHLTTEMQHFLHMTQQIRHGIAGTQSGQIHRQIIHTDTSRNIKEIQRQWIEACHKQIFIHQNQGFIQRIQNIVQIIIALGQLGGAGIQLIVDGNQLFVGSLHFLIGSFQFLIGSLQFLVGRLRFFIQRLQFLVGRFQLLDHRLQTFAADHQVRLQRRNARLGICLQYLGGRYSVGTVPRFKAHQQQIGIRAGTLFDVMHRNAIGNFHPVLQLAQRHAVKGLLAFHHVVNISPQLRPYPGFHQRKQIEIRPSGTNRHKIGTVAKNLQHFAFLGHQHAGRHINRRQLLNAGAVQILFHLLHVTR